MECVLRGICASSVRTNSHLKCFSRTPPPRSHGDRSRYGRASLTCIWGMPPGPSTESGELSKTLSLYKDHNPTFGRKRRAAMSSPANCSSLFSFRLISPGVSAWIYGGANWRVPNPRFSERRQLSLRLWGPTPALWRSSAGSSAARGSEELNQSGGGGGKLEVQSQQMTFFPFLFFRRETKTTLHTKSLCCVLIANRVKLQHHHPVYEPGKFSKQPTACAAFKYAS